METKAQAKFIRIAPQKVQVIVPAVKGRKVEEAIALLRFLPRKGARILYRVLHSAVANAGQNSVSVIDLASKKEITRIPVGEVPKRNITAVY